MSASPPGSPRPLESPQASVQARDVRRIGVVAKRGLNAARDHLERLGTWLRERQLEAVFETETAALAGAGNGAAARSRDDLPLESDLIIVMGGDGTLLSMATRTAVAGRDIPIVGVNFGSLGFLTEIRIDELYPALESVMNGTAVLDERAMLAADAYRGREHFDSRLVLNDVVFTKAALSRIIELSVSVSAGLMTKVKADGLIIASATGSTAYNLAAGGPIIHPRVDAIAVTPIAPHTLTNRPVVIPGSEVIDVRPHLTANDDEIYVTYDGQTGYPLQRGDVVRVRRSERRLRLVKAPARSYFDVLREKLKWGER
jgi:NAD+ kinase